MVSVIVKCFNKQASKEVLLNMEYKKIHGFNNFQEVLQVVGKIPLGRILFFLKP